MNTPQRIVLIVGAIVLWVMLSNVGSHYYSNERSDRIWDWQTGLVKGGFWCATVAAVYLALGKKK